MLHAKVSFGRHNKSDARWAPRRFTFSAVTSKLVYTHLDYAHDNHPQGLIYNAGLPQFFDNGGNFVVVAIITGFLGGV